MGRFGLHYLPGDVGDVGEGAAGSAEVRDREGENLGILEIS